MSFMVDQLKSGIKKEIKHIPRIVYHLEKLHKGLDAISAVLGKLEPKDFERFLNAINAMTGGKMTQPEVNTFAHNMSELAVGVRELDKLVEAGIKELA